MDILKEWEKIEFLEEQISEVEDNIKQYLKPLVQSGLDTGIQGKIVRLRNSKEELVIETEYWSSGGRYDYTYRLPLKVLNSDDPLKATLMFKEEQNNLKKIAERNKTLEEIERLKKKLES